jgi:DNA-binding LacI/PurR family transcriptional regulator
MGAERPPPGRQKKRASNRPATLADVARRAGVSPTTASFVVNNRPVAILPETRQRVLDAVRELHYSANAHVTALRERRSQTLGVHLHDYYRGLFLTDPVSGPIMAGITAASRAGRYHLLLYTGLPDYDGEAPVGAFLDRRVDGLVFLHAPDHSRLMAELAEVHLPGVVLFNRNAPPELGFIDADNVVGMRMAVEHLAALGHRRIAPLTGDIPATDRHDRGTGYEQALASCGLPRDPSLHVVLPWPPETEPALRALLALPDPPTAVVCFNDQLAVRVIQAAAALGAQVPRDLSVVGFDDSILATIISPALTTVRQPLQEMGRLAAAALIDIIGGVPPAERRTVVPVELVTRESTAPPSKSRRLPMKR